MNITLYKGCILTERYQEVFDVDDRGQEKTTFERYLDTLDSVTFEIPSAYVQDYGTFNLSYDFIKDGKNYHYLDCNYIRFNMTLGDNSEAVFAFVRNVIKSNTCAIIEYAVDVYHTYMKRCELRNSIITNFRKANNEEHRELPLPYITNGTLQHRTLNGSDFSFMIVARMQGYKLASGDRLSDRTTAYVKIVLTNKDRTQFDEYFSYDEAVNIVQALENYQGKKCGKGWDGWWTTDYNLFVYDIDDLYLIPYFLDLTYNFETLDNEFGAFRIQSMQGQGDTFYYVSVYQHTASVPINALLRATSGDWYEIGTDRQTLIVHDNFKIIAMGFLTNAIYLNQNGLDYTVKFFTCGGEIEFGIFMEINGSIIEISDVFSLLLPFENINGEQFAQRKIAKEMQIMKGITGITKGAINIAGSAAGLNINAKTGGRRMYKSGKYLSRGAMLAQQKTEDIANIGYGVVDIANGIMDIKWALEAKYQSSYAIDAKSVAFANCLYGFTIFVLNPSNENEVNGAIDEIGYEVFYRTNKLDANLYENTWDYNVVKFMNANIIGNCTQDVLEDLKRILENGVKIWYTENVS